MTACGLNQSQLAQRVGITQGAIAKIVSNNPGGSSHLHRIARELGTTPAYLTGETNDPSEGASPAPTPAEIAEQLDLVPVAVVDLAYGMGGTFADDPVNVEIMQFPAPFMHAMSPTSPALLTWARGEGDSMTPTIGDGDPVLIDRSQRRVEKQDLIWAFTIGSIASIKRLRIQGDRALILSDNTTVPVDEALLDEINIVGRVTRVIRRL
jgi:phage repressor protein C with HTH and peptisase S24 domain